MLAFVVWLSVKSQLSRAIKFNKTYNVSSSSLGKKDRVNLKRNPR